jgi:light-regulated signal transduction histidine kinase (bacteriophytochrome)
MLIRRKRAEDELARRALELSLANEELERFIWLASHDLNEPLRMVTLYTQWLAERLRDQLGPSEQEAIGFAVEGARRMHDLLEDFRAYAEAGSRTGEVGRVALDRVLAQALSGLAPQILAEGAVVRYQPLPEVLGRAPELCRVFQQLVMNGLTFRRPDVVPQIEIAADPGDDAWVISVSDNGIGIEADQLSRLFDGFHRGAARDKHPGSGVGLAICRKIIQRSGGRLWVESEPGQGSRFSFSLPACDEAPLRSRPVAAMSRR